jgi:hypothetical protein
MRDDERCPSFHAGERIHAAEPIGTEWVAVCDGRFRTRVVVENTLRAGVTCLRCQARLQKVPDGPMERRRFDNRVYTHLIRPGHADTYTWCGKEIASFKKDAKFTRTPAEMTCGVCLRYSRGKLQGGFQ